MKTNLSFNKRVLGDLRGILAFYEQESGTDLADAFYEKLMSKVAQVEKNPQQFPFSIGDRRRANLDRFPYHFLYRIKPQGVRILVLRHHHRNPDYGTTRR